MMVVVMMDGHQGNHHNWQDCNVFIGIVQAYSTLIPHGIYSILNGFPYPSYL